jgi:CRISPR-associated endonuclease Cas1
LLTQVIVDAVGGAVMVADRIYVASGYGLKLYVNRGHLVVEDGLGRQRRDIRFSRATSGLRRLVVLGHTGYITLDALRWIRDVGAAFVQIDRDGSLVTITAAERLHDAKLRRAQVLAADNDLGRRTMSRLLREKLDRQADLVERRLSHLKSTIVRDHKHLIAIGDAIREQAQAMRHDSSWAELRKLESIAGRYYWQTWAHVPIRLSRQLDRVAPAHWHNVGSRTSRVDTRRPRRAITPGHACLNYSYAILQAETTIAAYAVGLDPALGLMHADERYRGNLAIDLMEPLRPVVDEAVLDLLEQREFGRGDLLETPQGVCRIGAPLARELAERISSLRLPVGQTVEDTSSVLVRSPVSTTLTGRRHRAAVGNTTNASV